MGVGVNRIGKDREKVTAYVRRALEEKKDFQFELRILRPNGEVRHVRSMGVVRLEANGDVYSLFGVFQDITELVDARRELDRHKKELEGLVEERTEELRENERKFHRFYQIVPDIFMITGLEDGICVDVNDGFTNVTGYRREDVIGRPTTDLRLWEDNVDRERLVSGLKQHGIVKNLNANFRRKDGSLWPGMMSACLIDLKGKSNILSSTKDVTELKESQEAAIRANKAKSQFLSSMSHELRTPLNAILGFAQVMALDHRAPLVGGHKRAVEHILKGGQHLVELVDEVLELNTIEEGKFTISLNWVPARSVIDASLDMIRAPAESKRVLIIDRTAEMELPRLWSDNTRLIQILLNLFSNAIKYNRKGGTVTLSSWVRPDNDLVLSVSDTGIGIPHAQRDKLFLPFERLGRETGQIEGTGIGLTVTKRIVELLGGGIGFESEEGKGSTFWVSLPLGCAWSHSRDDCPAAAVP